MIVEPETPDPIEANVPDGICADIEKVRRNGADPRNPTSMLNTAIDMQLDRLVVWLSENEDEYMDLMLQGPEHYIEYDTGVRVKLGRWGSNHA